MTDLETASTSGDASTIADLSRRSAELHRHIERKFYELEVASDHHKEAAIDFEQRLEELQGG